MKKSKKRTVLFILFLLLIPFFLAFEPKLYIGEWYLIVNNFNSEIFLKVLFLISLVAVLITAYLKGKKD